MYSTCTFCHATLGGNEMLEAFPVGRRLAFDAAKGRLWVVCPSCRQWNLSPLDERWEAIEAAERLYRDTKLRAATEQVGLARLRERPIQAAFQFGRQHSRLRFLGLLESTHQRMLIVAGVGHHLRNLRLGDLVSKHAADTLALHVHFKHHPRGRFTVQAEKALQHIHDELHRGVVVVQQHHAVQRRLPGFRRSLLDYQARVALLFRSVRLGHISEAIMGAEVAMPSAAGHTRHGRHDATVLPQKCDPFVKSKQLLERVFDT